MKELRKEDLDFIKNCDSAIIQVKKDGESFTYRLGDKDDLITNLATLIRIIEKEEWITLSDMLEVCYLVRVVAEKDIPGFEKTMEQLESLTIRGE